MKQCAYCGKVGSLTREHIWPKGIIQRMPELEARYLDSIEKFVQSELIISDVCADCNNKKLSVLDGYLCQLYDTYFGTFIEGEEEIVFKYDYELLLRSLLKITYNSSRTKSRDNNYFSSFREFILNGGKSYENIIIKLDFVRPYILDGEKIYPKSARCGTIETNCNADYLALRVVSINSYYFYIIIYKNEILDDAHINEYKEVFNRIPGIIIHPYKDTITIKSVSDRDTHNIHIDFIEKTKSPFSEYINKKANKLKP